MRKSFVLYEIIILTFCRLGCTFPDFEIGNKTYNSHILNNKAPVRNSKLWVLDTCFCHGITKFITFFKQFLWKMMEIWEKLPKTMGASTHTFKNCGCLSTHSTHTNGGPDLVFGKDDLLENLKDVWLCNRCEVAITKLCNVAIRNEISKQTNQKSSKKL